MSARRRRAPGGVAAALAVLAACQPARYRPAPIDLDYRPPVGVEQVDPAQRAPGDPAPPADAPTAEPPGDVGPGRADPIQASPFPLDTVLRSVTGRYPPLLAALLERDLASGRLQQAMGGFDTNLSAKVGGTLQGFYESTVAQGLIEQPLATGDTVYGGYRITDGFLPDYYDSRTQDDGEVLFGGRFPLLRNRAIDGRRAGVRQAEIDVELAEPTIAGARIAFVRAATDAYYGWRAAGSKLEVARELLRLATDRQDGLRRAVERQFLAEIDLTDNERLIAQRQVFVVRAERAFQAAALALSLYLRDGDDRPVVAGERRLPPSEDPVGDVAETLDGDLGIALRQRPELARIRLLVDRIATERDLADNQLLPDLDLIVEAESSLSGGPYTDREDFELFVGGELKLPLQRRDARGRFEQATARLSRLRLEQRFARDRIVNEVVDARSAVRAAHEQLQTTRRNVELARELVAAEQRAFDLGRSDLLRIQLREVQLADAQVLEVDALLGYRLARAAYRAALGDAAAPR